MKFRSTGLALCLAIATALVSPTIAVAYPVDCAILLCLAGGWPASAECSHARAVFIRRITPWPIEPPLQIWRRPLGASFDAPPRDSFSTRLYKAAMQSTSEAQIRPFISRPGENLAREMVRQVVVSNQADVDISGSEFDFVRSIRVFHIQYTRIVGRDRECTEYDQTTLGTYGAQGDFGWATSHYGNVPSW